MLASSVSKTVKDSLLLNHYVDRPGILATVISLWSHCDLKLWSHWSFHTFHPFYALHAFEDPYRWSQRHGASEAANAELRDAFSDHFFRGQNDLPLAMDMAKVDGPLSVVNGLYFHAMFKNMNMKIGYRQVGGPIYYRLWRLTQLWTMQVHSMLWSLAILITPIFSASHVPFCLGSPCLATWGPSLLKSWACRPLPL